MCKTVAIQPEPGPALEFILRENDALELITVGRGRRLNHQSLKRLRYYRVQLFAETMSFGLRLRERAIDAIKSKISEIQCWLEARLQEFTVLVRRRQRTCHKTGPSTACVASTKSIWQELREIWPNNVQHPGRSQQCSRCQLDLREYVLDTEPSPAQLSTMVFYS